MFMWSEDAYVTVGQDYACVWGLLLTSKLEAMWGQPNAGLAPGVPATIEHMGFVFLGSLIPA